jgi:hypothetical protein
MQFILLIYGGGGANVTPSEMQGVIAAHTKLTQELRDAGALVTNSRLQLPATARTVRSRAGTLSVHDGPFPETHEQLGGYYIVEAPDMETAVGCARRIPIFDGGGVEVRALWTP